jgi:ADP-heptose:LPS heptosyltransferase
MRDITKICAFYSHGPHFLPLLQFLRTQHPAAEIVAVVPPNYPADRIAERADTVLIVEKADSFRQLLGLRRLLREQHFNLLVVMFDSPRLRLLAAASGIPHRYCFGPNRRYVPLQHGVVRQLLRTLHRNLRGRIQYAYIWYVVHYRPVDRHADK